MKVNDVSLHSNDKYLNFGAKLPIEPLKSLSENGIKTASTAAAAIGIASVAISQKEDRETEDELIKKILTQHIGREAYIVVRDNFLDNENGLDSYLNYKAQNLIKEDEHVDYIKGLMKEILFERVKDKSKPDDFSDITLIQSSKKIKYANIALAEEMLKYYLEKGFSYVQIAAHTGCTYKQVRERASKAGTISGRQQASQNVEKIFEEKKDEIRALINKGATLKSLAETFQCSIGSINTILSQLEIKTSCQKERDIKKSILNSQILDYRTQGMTLKEISEILGISVSTIKVRGNTQKSLSDENLSSKLMELYCNNNTISDDKELSNIINALYDNIRDFGNKLLLKKFIKNLEQASDGRKKISDLKKSEVIDKIYIELEKISQKNLAKAEIFTQMSDIIQELIAKQKDNLITIFSEYQGKDKTPNNVANCLYLINAFYEGYEDLTSLERKITYWDAKNNSETILVDAENFARESNGLINEEKAGQYIINANIYHKLVNENEYPNYPKTMIDYIKDSYLPPKLLIKYLIKIEDILNSENKTLLENCLSKFSTNDGDIETAIIKSFVEELYLNVDTEVPCVFENGQKHTAVLTSKAKKDIYEYYKYPNCLTIFSKFETAMHKPARESSSTGIKPFATYNEVKIKGVGDRLFSSEKDKFVFDRFENQHVKKS